MGHANLQRPSRNWYAPSMHVITSALRAGGIGLPPSANDATYEALLDWNSSLLAMMAMST